MYLFNKEDVYIGYSLSEFSNIREALATNHIKYTYNIRSHQGQFAGSGTIRGTFGSFGMNRNYETQYTVSVKRKDSDEAQYLVNEVLHPKVIRS